MSVTTTSAAPTALKAGLVMILAMASFTAGDTMTKLMAGEVPVGQIIFFRGIVATILTALLAGKSLAQATLIFQKGVLVRSLSDVTGTLCFITALMHVPIANLTAVMQAVPLLVIGFAALFLGETVGWRRTLAILVGLAGVLLVVKPSPTSFTIYDGLSLGLILAIALRDIFTRRLNFDVPSTIIVFANALFVTLSGIVLYPFEEWVALSAASPHPPRCRRPLPHPWLCLHGLDHPHGRHFRYRHLPLFGGALRTAIRHLRLRRITRPMGVHRHCSHRRIRRLCIAARGTRHKKVSGITPEGNGGERNAPHEYAPPHPDCGTLRAMRIMK